MKKPSEATATFKISCPYCQEGLTAAVGARELVLSCQDPDIPPSTAKAKKGKKKA